MAADIDLDGLIDLHIHSAPDIVPRSINDMTAARQAQSAGMRAILIKSHHTLTADRAALVETILATEGGQNRRLCVFGGLALNQAVGGLNPAAVEIALKMGARQIWFPTRPAGAGNGRVILDERGALLPVVHEILELLRASPAILGSGHLACQETRALVIAARSAGLEKVLVTHPDSPSIAMPITLQQELALLGARFERCYLAVAPGVRAPILLEQMAAAIRTVGIHASLLSTDLGQAGLPVPVDGLRAFLTGLAGLGFSTSELHWMAGDHPAELLS